VTLYVKGRKVERLAMLTRAQVRQVDCPACGAPPGYPCNAAREGTPRTSNHRERIRAASAALEQPDTG